MNENQNYMENPKYRKIGKILFVIVALIILVKAFSPDGYRGPDAQKDTIVVSGKGELTVKPDMATVSFSVTSENLDVSKASDAVNTKIGNIVTSLKADGVSESDIKTTGYNIYPRYNYVNGAVQAYPYGGGTQVLAAYVVTQSVELKIRDLSKAGKVITDLSGLGVTDMSGLTFTNDKYDDLVRQARDAAIADARSQAQSLAKSLGVRLVKIVAFSENGNYPIMYNSYSAGVMAKDSAVPAVLSTGENKITSNVSVTYEIR